MKWFFGGQENPKEKNEREIIRLYEAQAVFRCRGAEDLPTAFALHEAVHTRLEGVLLFENLLSETEKARCVEKVRAALPTSEVRGIDSLYGFDRIRFHRILPSETILEHAPQFAASAREFRRLATILCRRLASKIGISSTQLSYSGRFLPPEQEVAQSGKLSANWEYFFHGYQCGFTHRKTGQTLDVEFGFSDEFGVLDPWFWLQFLRSTPQFHFLAQLLPLGFTDAARMMDTLRDAGFLLEIEGSPEFVSPHRRGIRVADQ